MLLTSLILDIFVMAQVTSCIMAVGLEVQHMDMPKNTR